MQGKHQVIRPIKKEYFDKYYSLNLEEIAQSEWTEGECYDYTEDDGGILIFYSPSGRDQFTISLSMCDTIDDGILFISKGYRFSRRPQDRKGDPYPIDKFAMVFKEVIN